MAFIDKNLEQAWSVDNSISNTGINRRLYSSNVGLKYVYDLTLDPKINNYKQNKNYQYITELLGYINTSIYIKFSSPFKSTVASITRVITDNNISSGNVEYYTYANPISNEYSKNLIQYGATEAFTSSVIKSSTLNEIDFLINGYREFKYSLLGFTHSSQPNGWSYDNNSYVWYYSPTSSVSPTYSIFGSGLDIILETNYIAKIIDYDTFNLDFTYEQNFYYGTSSTNGIDLYLVEESKLKDGVSSWGSKKLILTSTSTGTQNCYNLKATNLDGTKNYLVFSAVYSNFHFSSKISNINIYGGYNNTFNNTQILPILLSNSYDISSTITDASYNFQTTVNNFTYSISSKIGNGSFQMGIWENGVWNNGWRDDTTVKDFDDISSSVLYSYDISWKIKISGSTYSCSSFEIGDKVAIGNIVAIDINENRKLIRDYYRIVDKDILNNTWIEVSLDTTFPYRRIEKDSPNHKIKITKNVWLSGGFFNGYFSGVWNNGLFKGYPKITEMFNTHWIDGFFNGGHFNSVYPTYNFTDILGVDSCGDSKVTLIFDYGHYFLPGDYVIVTKTDTNNSSYNGITKVLNINDTSIKNTLGEFLPNITIDKFYGFKLTDNLGNPIKETGSVVRYTASSVIQNFKFYDTNRSKLKSSESSISSSVFSFNSWIDTNYDNTRAVTLGRSFKSYEPITGKSINKNNLYGYPTYDILSSSARFRNSYDLNYELYKLGTKYKIFTDFIGDGSAFNEPFNETNFTPFYDNGWTYSSIASSNVSLKRSDNIISVNDSNAIKYIDSGVTGKELWISATSSGLILNNTNINIDNSRYSIIELDVITHSVATYDYLYENPDNYTIKMIGNTDSFIESAPSSTEIIATHSIINTLGTLDVYDIIVSVNLFGPINTTIINLIAPNGKIINLKNKNFGYGGRMINTKFSLNEKYIKFSDTPYNINNDFAYGDTYLMDREIGQGLTPYISDTITLGDLITNIYGIWTLYVKFDIVDSVDLSNWSINIRYKELVSLNNDAVLSFPVLNFSNFNSDISNQTLDGDLQPIYKKMSHLPIINNLNHLVKTNSFRLDTVEKTSPDRYNGFGQNQNTKKYEYFYNKTDLMLNFSGSGATGGSQSMVVLDNIKMYEVDMIPFFKYFEDSNIYKGIQIPYEGLAPNIDYLKSDFVFVDNITIGLDSINKTIIDNAIDCIPNVITVNTDKVIVFTYEVDITSITETTATCGGDITIEGNISLQQKGICWSKTLPLSLGSSGNFATYEGSFIGPFGSTLTGLTNNTLYYYAAYATVNNITTYGMTYSFTTVKTPPDYSADDYSPTDYSTI